MRNQQNTNVKSKSYFDIEKKENSTLSWIDIDNMNDAMISFCLSKEGKTVKQIALIRNLSEFQVKNHLLEYKKSELKNSAAPNNTFLTKNEKSLHQYLSLSKAERESYIASLDIDEKNNFVNLVIDGLEQLSNIEDIMVILWTAGEINIKELYGKLKYFSSHPHGNLRRVSMSSMGKTQNREFIPYLIQGFKDKKPQVRQYAVIAFGKLAVEEEIYLLNDILKNPKEETYVRRAAQKSVDFIKEQKRAGDLY